MAGRPKKNLEESLRYKRVYAGFNIEEYEMLEEMCVALDRKPGDLLKEGFRNLRSKYDDDIRFARIMEEKYGKESR